MQKQCNIFNDAGVASYVYCINRDFGLLDDLGLIVNKHTTQGSGSAMNTVFILKFTELHVPLCKTISM